MCEEPVALMTHSVSCELPHEWSFLASYSMCLFVQFTGVTPAAPRCVIVLNMVPFRATQAHLHSHTQMDR